MRTNAFEVGALEPANEARLAEVHDFHASRRAVVKLLKCVPVLGAEGVGVEAEARDVWVWHVEFCDRLCVDSTRGASSQEPAASTGLTYDHPACPLRLWLNRYPAMCR